MMKKSLKRATVAVAALSLAVSGIPATAFPQNMAIVKASADDEIFESGDFRFKVTGKNTQLILLGFTEGAAGKATLSIPATVNYDDYDFPVAYIASGAFKNCTNITSIVFTDKDGNESKTTNLTKIGENAFEGCTGLTTVTLAEGVTTLGGGTFENCTNLTTVNLPATIAKVEGGGGNSPFSGCSSLQKVNFAEGTTTIPNDIFHGLDFFTDSYFNMPATITTIGEGAFSSMTKLDKITLPEGLQTIGREAFNGCSSLTAITFPKTLTTLGSESFKACNRLTEVTLPKTLTTVKTNLGDESPFVKCENLTKVTFETGMEKIPAYILNNASSVKEITIPETVKIIGDEAFGKLTQLKTITLPNNLESIERGVFSGCSSLTAITFPETLTTLGSSSFRACNRITEVRLPKTLTTLKTNLGDDSPFIECENLKKVVFEEGTTVIPESILHNAAYVEEVSIPDSVTTIGRSAFSGCTNISSIALPANLETIGSASFRACNRLTEVTLPKTLTTIKTNLGDDSPFIECENLTKVTFQDGAAIIPSYILNKASSVKQVVIPSSVTVIQKDAFKNITENITIYGYVGSYAETYAKENNIPFVSSGDAPTVTETPVVSNAPLVTDTPAVTGTPVAPTQNPVTSTAPAVTGTPVVPTQNPVTPTAPANSETPVTTNAPEATVKPTTAPVKEPKKVTVSSVKRNSAKKATVKWKKVSDAAGYQVTYSTKSNFKGAKTKNVAKSKNSFTITGLKKGQVYYVKVRAYKKDSKDKKITGAYSAVKKIKK
ncbi:MAG: leucine-rich repeat protein [Lachnospiraceae bacterium]|nr:leucine-rich repeat protein [Lachnospiraceae bacterium]